jgi:hypothetical protein
MKKIFFLAIASVLTLGAVTYAAGNRHQQPKSCANCTEKVCTPACMAACGGSCCSHAK